ncbi:hypothetical protein WMY93_015849 [Mugilogobius chulae]|uniref:C2H2-type domain-containing protein n=1 Tax=Mugilogobius chulae TaxID=88201 RepID=A0AAW0NTU5_9GOBI
MSKSQMFRALVNARLSAAADEIFALFERTIAEFEEEICRCKKSEHERRLVSAQESSSTVQMLLQSSSVSPERQLISRHTDTQWFKDEPEEYSIDQESEEYVCVKMEESSPLQQGQSEPREDTKETEEYLQLQVRQMEPREDTGTHLQPQTEGDTSETDSEENWTAPLSCPDAEMETTETSEAAKKRYHCIFCEKAFNTSSCLNRHMRTHTGEKRYSCPVCQKQFSESSTLKTHARTHTKERPYSCAVCMKRFPQKANLQMHMRTHTGDKPYSCPICTKSFSQNSNLRTHMNIHTGTKPYSCSICNKSFVFKHSRDRHLRTHEKQQSVQRFIADAEYINQ